MQRTISIFEPFVDGFAGAIEKHKTVFVACYSILFLAICGLTSAVKLMWFDELATYYPAKLPTVRALVDFFWDGLDVHTPTASLLVRGTMHLFGDGPVVDRLPFSAAYLAFCIFLFIFVARRCPTGYAAMAMIFPALTPTFYYATEIRCYALVLAFTGLALVSWQAAAEGRTRPLAVVGLFAGLAGTICSHYYGVFLCVPFAVAELTRTYIRKCVDWAVWAAVALSPSILLIFLPAIRNAAAIYRGHVTPLTNLDTFLESYRATLNIPKALILAASMVCLLAARRMFRAMPTSQLMLPLPEWVLAGAFFLLPLYIMPVSGFIGAFFARYVLACTAGGAILMAFFFCQYFQGSRHIGCALTLIFLVGFFVQRTTELRAMMRDNGGWSKPLGTTLHTASWSRELERSSLPIAAVPELFFMKFQHYASDAVRPRVYYPADEIMARRYGGFGGGDLNLLTMSHALSLQVLSFRDFVSQHPNFLMCVSTGEYTNAWLLHAVLEYGADVRLRSQSKPYYLFEVTMPAHDQHKSNDIGK